MLHVAPSQPGEHLHLKMSPSSWHVPPLLHVASSHWLSPEITVDPIVFLTPCIHVSTQTKTQQTGWVIKIEFRTGVAGFSLPAISTFAVEIVHQVLTCSLVQAGVQAAVIYV